MELIYSSQKPYILGTCSTDHKQLNIYSRVLAKSLRVRIAYSRAHVLCSQAEVLHSLVRTRELRVPRACVHYERKYYTRTYGTNRSSHAHAHSYTTRKYSYIAHECCIDRSRALAPPSRVKHERALSCL